MQDGAPLKSKKETADMRLKKHLNATLAHFSNASNFLVECQIKEPYVQKGILQGSVCPWEIGALDTHGFTILEDFHDTLEAIWVWSYYRKLSKDVAYKPNIKMAWKYVENNFERFIPPLKEDEGLYDCSHLMLGASLYEKVFADKSYHKLLETAGNRLARYLLRIRSLRGREYSEPWWMATCLGSAARSIGHHEWLEVTMNLVRRGIIEQEMPFSNVENEPHHKGPEGHDFFSQNANKVLALLTCFPSEPIAKEIVAHKFLPSAPKRFVKRQTDENPWNAMWLRLLEKVSCTLVKRSSSVDTSL